MSLTTGSLHPELHCRLREAAKRVNPFTSYYGTFCSCKDNCSRKNCSCQLTHKPCSTCFHSGRSCLNHRDKVQTPPTSQTHRQKDNPAVDASTLLAEAAPPTSQTCRRQDTSTLLTKAAPPTSQTYGQKDTSTLLTEAASPTSQTRRQKNGANLLYLSYTLLYMSV